MKLLPLALLLAGIPWNTRATDLNTGNSVFGQNQYTEYVPGELPLVIAAPHGGRLIPADIPNRSGGVIDSDANTQELARTIAAVIHAETGRHIHLVICRLHRSKLDANREIVEAALGQPSAEQAWREHHGFIEQACADAVKKHGFAFLIDLHGHGHPDAQVELGYLHPPIEMADCADALSAPAFAQAGSLEYIAERSGLSYAELLHGETSLGALLEERGFASTPSPRRPVPGSPYFKGGYTIARHCDVTRRVAGLQIEANRPRLRDTAVNRLAFAKALAGSLNVFFPAHLGLRLDGSSPSPTGLPAPSAVPVDNSAPDSNQPAQ